MTILEKIKFEEDWLSEVNLTKENIKIAFDGIRATVLEQQPCEDCIRRDQAVYVASGYCAPQNIADESRKLPPVTPSRPHGYWEETVVLTSAYDIMGNKTWASQMRCNKCGFTTFAVEGKFSQYNFCPECGVDMREDGE